jgi:hypothetical protein
MRYKKTLLLLLIVCFSCVSQKNSQAKFSAKKQTSSAKFEPANGNCLFFIGQDLKATGGLDNYKEGYCDSFDVPAGFTVYTNFSPGAQSYGYIQKGNDGIKTIANWGADDNCAQYYINDKKYENSSIAIGLSMVGHEKKVANGHLDYLIKELGEWIKKIDRPVFLRIGYEFDGWEWNHYKKKQYLAAWRHIRLLFDEMKINNVAYVWQSKGNGSNQETLEQWYPGDDLVDWCAYSYFNNPDQEMLTFARKHKKPVFIAEATPVLGEGSLYSPALITDPEMAKQIWEKWFIPFIKTINDNKDCIKAFSYINANWSEQPMWRNNSIFQKVDSRIQKSEFISKKWKEEMANSRYLKSTPELLTILKNNQ